FGAASAGGHFGAELKFAGYDGVIIEGVAAKPTALVIRDGGVELRDASHLWGSSTTETEKILREELGDRKVKVACIGPAGENLVRFAAIINDSTRAAGRCGLGAVMGAKRLKAIAVRGTKDVQVSDFDGLMKLLDRLRELGRYETLAIGLSTYGTASIVSYVHAIGGFPTHNFKLQFDYEEIEPIDQESIRESLVLKKSACFGCPIGCGRLSRIPEGKYADELGEGPEYEHINTLAGRCGCYDLNALMKAHNLCNELGMDGITAGGVIGFAMECYEAGVLDADRTGGLELRWGDADIVIELLERIARREGVGDLLAEGVKRAAERLGRGAEKYAMHVKGLEFPGYEPRAMKGAALSFATANRGADHLGALMTLVDFGMATPLAMVTVDPLELSSEKVRLVKELEDWMQVLDSAIICKFFGVLLRKEELASLISLVTGFDFSVKTLERIGERIWNLERLFNLREGLRGKEDDWLPDRFYEEPLPKGAASGEVIPREEFERRLSEYYRLRGWDEGGVPTAGKLRELGLSV
ncbi:aldehyde ferredoxin oxidoreductase family protein, partial [Candidatus Alkanophaga liquidiphilum]